jgi:uncharacterized protein involved in copper resistance
MLLKISIFSSGSSWLAGRFQGIPPEWNQKHCSAKITLRTDSAALLSDLAELVLACFFLFDRKTRIRIARRDCPDAGSGGWQGAICIRAMGFDAADMVAFGRLR